MPAGGGEGEARDWPGSNKATWYQGWYRGKTAAGAALPRHRLFFNASADRGLALFAAAALQGREKDGNWCAYW
jgi:hypothetical protein